jgi:hypothetical protein
MCTWLIFEEEKPPAHEKNQKHDMSTGIMHNLQSLPIIELGLFHRFQLTNVLKYTLP